MIKINHRWKTLMFLIVCATVHFTGCGKDDATATTTTSYSCGLTVSSITTCYDLTGSALTNETAAKTMCSSISSSGTTSTYAASACSTTGRIGSCKINSGQTSEYTARYLTGYNSTTAAAACTASSGTYTAD
jgi:hypothetical protein